MERIKRSWALAKASFEVLSKDKELLIFPILSSIALILVSVSFLVPTLVSSVLDSVFDTGLSFFGYVVPAFYVSINQKTQRKQSFQQG